MENTQVKKLKFNVVNIKNSLFGYNKKLIKVKKDKIKLFAGEESKKKISKKESLLETESSVRKSIVNVGQRLISGPMTLIDKFKEFFGFILLGILVNNLPTIIQKLQGTFIKIKTFLDQNPWIMDAVKFGFEKIGEGIVGLVKFIRFVRPYIGGSFKFALDTIRATKNQIGTLIKTFDELNLSFGGLIRDLKIDDIPDPNKDPANYSNFIAGGGNASLENKGQSVEEVINQGKKNIQDQLPRSTGMYGRYVPGSQQQKPPQKFAKGGTVNPQKQISRIETGRTTVKQSAPKTPFARPGGTAKGRKARQAVNSFKVFQANVKDQSIDIQSQQKNYNVFDELLKKFQELQKLKDKEKSTDGDGGGGGGGLQPGDITVEGGSSDFWLLSLISMYENSNPQGAADVAQSIYNRMGYSGRTARQVILSRKQYEPVGKYGPVSEWNKVVDKETALAHIKKYPGNAASGSGLIKVSAALLNKSMQQSAANFVGNRPDFRSKSYESSNNEMTDDATRNGQTFGFNRGSSYKGKLTSAVSVPSFMDADVISSYTPTELTGEGTFIMGRTGRSTGPHFHFGPMELLDSKTLSFVGKRSQQGLTDVRVAVFRVARALIAKKIDFIFSNTNQSVYANQRLTDKQLQNYILSEQNAHMSRGMGSSWGGIDITTSGGNTRLPLPVGPVKYYEDGFGNRAQILGTKAFVAHGASGSKATPTSQIKKKEVPLKVKPILTPEDLQKIKERMSKSKPGTGESIKIPGVGTYVRGTEGIWPLQKAVDKYYDENGDPLTKEEFEIRSKKVFKDNNLISKVPFTEQFKPTRDNTDQRIAKISNSEVGELNTNTIIQPIYFVG